MLEIKYKKISVIVNFAHKAHFWRFIFTARRYA